MNNFVLPTFHKLNYIAQHLKPTHELILGDLLNIDLFELFVAGVGFEPPTFRL